MGYECGQVEKAFLRAILDESIEEEVQAGMSTVAAGTTTPSKVAEGTIEAGYDGVVMGVAVERLDDVVAWIKRADKQVFKDGLEAAGLGDLDQETPLFVKLTEKQAWELGLTNTGGSEQVIGWRIRIRKLAKE